MEFLGKKRCALYIGFFDLASNAFYEFINIIFLQKGKK